MHSCFAKSDAWYPPASKAKGGFAKSGNSRLKRAKKIPRPKKVKKNYRGAHKKKSNGYERAVMEVMARYKLQVRKAEEKRPKFRIRV
jgi:hypothetical protein